MPRARREEIRKQDTTGLKYFAQLRILLDELHQFGCERNLAWNRKVHMDQYCMLILHSFLNAIARSLCGIQKASELKTVQKKFG